MFKKMKLYYNSLECDMIIMRDQNSLLQIRRVKDMNKVMKMVTATVSHDIRSPLTSINMFADILMSRVKNKQSLSLLVSIKTSS